jgi:alpha-D-ribose 1-methylphosphonate 5-triphosphate diphosphatase
MLSHDDETPEMRRRYAALGCDISEFPLDRATAEAARDLGSPIVLGSPNVLRGGSHCGRLSAADSVAAGLCTILSSDYYYPAPLHAAFRLVADGVVGLEQAWRLVSVNPAKAVGLDDRGEIAPGKRADLIIVDDSDPAYPRVVATFVAGRVAYAASDDLRRVA